MLRLSAVLLVVIFAGAISAQTPTSTDSNDRAEDTGTRSVDGTGIRSVDGTGVRAVDDGNGTQSVDGTGIQSVDGTGIQSVDGTGMRSADDATGTQSVDGTGILSVDGTGVLSRSGSQSYTVSSGDTLGSIARQFYGDASQWQRIFDANTAVLSDADVIPVGVVLTIPASD